MACTSFTFVIISVFFGLHCLSHAESDTLKQGQQLKDWEQLVSAGGTFRLGFFSPDKTSIELGSSGPRYLGIWYDRIPFYSVWVANPKNPVPDSSGAVTIDGNGVLKIAYAGGSPIVLNSNQGRNASAGNVTATLLDSGNFVVREVNPDGVSGRVLWQSFDYPTNMLLPEMKLGVNLKTGHEWSLTSWLSDKVPAPGAFRLSLDSDPGVDQLLVWNRDDVYWRSGAWRNGSSNMSLELSKEYVQYEFKFIRNENERSFSYSVKDKSVLSRWDLDSLGQITVFNLVAHNNSSSWIFETSSPCSTDLKNQSAVCITEKPSLCRNQSDFFVPRRGYMDKWAYFDSNTSLALSDCHARCWKNCTCVAYKSSYSDGTGCQFWPAGSKFISADTSEELLYILDSEQNQGK